MRRSRQRCCLRHFLGRPQTLISISHLQLIYEDLDGSREERSSLTQFCILLSTAYKLG